VTTFYTYLEATPKWSPQCATKEVCRPPCSLPRIGLDLAKQVFQLHGVTENGQVVLRRQLRRSEMLAFFKRLQPCLYSFYFTPNTMNTLNSPTQSWPCTVQGSFQHPEQPRTGGGRNACSIRMVGAPPIEDLRNVSGVVAVVRGR
jgi:hypothetical protein